MTRETHPVDVAAARLGVPILIALLSVGSAPVAEAREDPAGALAGVQAWLDGTRDLQARFEQRLVSGAFGAGAEESGTLYVSRPGRMRWEYRSPDPKIALIVGDRTTLYLENEAQFHLGRLDREGELLPALLAGDRRLADLFDVDFDRLDDPAEEVYRLRLQPRGGEDGFESIVITTRGPEWAIESAEVLDAAGNRMLYRFFKIRRNRGVPDAAFVLEPPDGVEVLGTHDPGAARP